MKTTNDNTGQVRLMEQDILWVASWSEVALETVTIC